MSSLLSIIIVNYRTPGLIVDCLATIFASEARSPFEVIVVDNASGDDSFSIITTEYPSIKWIQMPYNAGFARANNEGIRQCGGQVVLLLNSDTLNEENAIDQCYRSFLSSDYVACGVQLLNPDRSSQISGNYFMTGGLNNLLPLPYLGNFIKWLGLLFKVKKPNVEKATETTEVHWINGAFLMVKRTAFEKAGLMDEDFFLYAEEAEWCARLGKFGKLCIYGQYHIIHLQGESANAAFDSAGSGYYNLYDRKGLQIMLSNFVRLRKQFGISWFTIQLLIYTFAIIVFGLGSFFRNALKGKNPFREFGAVRGFSKNVLKVWSFSPAIVRNKPFFYKAL